MDRLFCMLLLCLMLTPAMKTDPAQSETEAQPVFFSMLFPQLIPRDLLEAEAGEAVAL